jgi:hypothetical protein
MVVMPHIARNRFCEAEVKGPAQSRADLAKLVNDSGFANGRAPSLYGKHDDEECRHMLVQLR